MEAIDKARVQNLLDQYCNQPVYLHLETTNGSYASLRGDHAMSVCAFIRNGQIRYSRGVITGDNPYCVGLKLDNGWVYAEGLTDYEVMEGGELLLAGHDEHGQVAIALQLSTKPFPM